MTSPVFSTISRGSSGLPVAWAGHTEVQRPHIVQASVSISCFQVNVSIVEAPNVSSSVDSRSGSGFMAPFGRSRSDRYMLSGEVNMWRIIVPGMMARKAQKLSDVGDPPRLMPAVEVADTVDQLGQRIADDRPPLEVRGVLDGDAERLGPETGHADGGEHAENHRMLRPALDGDPVRPP